jgi:hypothetical protein
VINAIKFSIEEIEASDQYFDHTGSNRAGHIEKNQSRAKKGNPPNSKMTAKKC